MQNDETGSDIFKDGPSPELEARWDKMEDAIKLYPTVSKRRKNTLLKKYPEIRFEVQCHECGRDY